MGKSAGKPPARLEQSQRMKRKPSRKIEKEDRTS